MATASNASKEQHGVRFVITGFGAFNGVPTNPTTQICEELPEYLSTWKLPPSKVDNVDNKATLYDLIYSIHIMETSVQAVERELHEIYNSLDDGSDITTIVLHLGVAAGSKQFALESCAYNEATFRVPDEQGYKPTGKCIREACESVMTTSITNLAQIVDALNKTDIALGNNGTTTMDTGTENVALPTTICTQSYDPGRFVCNYTYFYSLYKCCSMAKDTKANLQRTHAMFLHIPRFDVLDIEKQKHFIASLLIELYKRYRHHL